MGLVNTASVLSEVRNMLSDSVAPYRWSDLLLRSYVYDGETMAVKNHPESQYNTVVVNSAPVKFTASDGNMTVTDRWLVPIAHYVVWRCLLEDAEDSANRTLAETHYKFWVAEMGAM